MSVSFCFSCGLVQGPASPCVVSTSHLPLLIHKASRLKANLSTMSFSHEMCPWTQRRFSNIWLLKSRAKVTGDKPREWVGVSVHVSALLLCSNPPPSRPGLWGPHRQAPTMRATLPGPKCPNFGTKHTSRGGRVLREIPAAVRELHCKRSQGSF